MTLEERGNPDLINGSRRRRIARGSGSSTQAVNQLLDQFHEMRTMMRQMSSGKGQWARLAQQFGGGTGAGMPGMPAIPATAGYSNQGKHSGGKKTGKAARKEKRKHKARSGRR